MVRSLFVRFAHRIGSIAKKSFALATIGAFGGVGYQYNEIKKFDEARLGRPEKKVLILPFHRMKIVERKERSLKDTLKALATSSRDKKDERQMEVEIRELINTIHAAAEDPNIVSIYGSFGQGFGFESGGFAHIEEIRNAIKVFNESRRIQNGTSENCNKDNTTSNNDNKKHSFAFADTFDNPSDTCNNEFFLASAFSQVHLQSRGNMNLFGVSLSSLFLKGALDKYGIKVHIFKHGKYKSTPTEKRHTKTIVESLNRTLCSSIVDSRSISDGFNDSAWEKLHDYGTMTAENAREIGFVDYLTNIDPLANLINANKEEASFSQLQKKSETPKFDNFQADDSLSYDEYLSLLRKRKEARKMKWRVRAVLQDAAEKTDVAKTMLSMLGYEAPYFNVDKNEYDQHSPMQTNEKIALLQVTGAITDSVAREVRNSLRKIKNDTDVKCVILRIDSRGGSVTASETILEECRDLPQPIICSFSNFAASGGYYIATHSEKIFALPTTLTGSIGVFGLKIDATDFGRRHRIETQHVTSGKHGLTYALFDPLTKAVKMNLLRNVDRIYCYFKEIVADGRKMSPQEVEEIAQGRVWTGEQAREIGLVDELGGIDHAISYAMKKYATTGSAHVELWPHKPSLKDCIIEQILSSTTGKKPVMTTDLVTLLLSGRVNLSNPLDVFLLEQKSPGLMLTMDEDCAINFGLNNYFKKHLK